MSELDKAIEEYFKCMDAKTKMGTLDFVLSDGFRHGAAFVASKLKHSDWTHLDPPEPCGCITCIKLRDMGL